MKLEETATVKAGLIPLPALMIDCPSEIGVSWSELCVLAMLLRWKFTEGVMPEPEELGSAVGPTPKRITRMLKKLARAGVVQVVFPSDMNPDGRGWIDARGAMKKMEKVAISMGDPRRAAIKAIEAAALSDSAAARLRRLEKRAARKPLHLEGEDGRAMERPKNVNDLRELWYQQYSQKWPTMTVGRWTMKERGQAKQLLRLYSDWTLVEKAIRYVFDSWSDFAARFGISGFPTIGLVLGFRAQIFGEAQTSERIENKGRRGASDNYKIEAGKKVWKDEWDETDGSAADFFEKRVRSGDKEPPQED